MTLWQARLDSAPDKALVAFTESLSFDRRLAPYDLAASIAHVNGLARGGLLDSSERDTLVATLEAVGQEMAAGKFEFRSSDEDVHTAIERRVTELAGETGAKVHTGRSRNDQVATAMRLWVRSELLEVVAGLIGLQDALAARAVEAGDSYLPGYTHLQRAQPVLLAHHFLAHGWALARDVDRLFDCLDRVDVSPLGAGALAGSSLPLDPDGVAAELGFARRFDNSLDAVADRDFVAEALFVVAMVAVHLSRIGEEIVLWSTDEFGFVTLADEFSTGSSMLPQRKNADVAELARGKCGRLIGNLTGWLATMKGLPLAYNRDLQEDKEPLFDSVDQVGRALVAVAGMVATMRLNVAVMQQAADSPYGAAIDLAEWLVVRGTPFRQAHGLVASLVKESFLRQVPLEELVEASDKFGVEAVSLLAPGVAVTRRTTPGGAGPVPLRLQADAFARCLEEEASRLDALASRMKPVIPPFR